MNEIQILPKEDKKVKPLLIIQYKGEASEKTLQQLSDTALKAFIDGCLICDDRLRIIAFDDEGKLAYNSDMQ